MSRTDLDPASLANALRRMAGDGSIEWVMEPMQASVLLDIADLLAENAKLRELVRAYQEVAEYPTCRLYDECKPHPFSHTCAECDGGSCLIQRLSDELRELGIEVD